MHYLQRVSFIMTDNAQLWLKYLYIPKMVPSRVVKAWWPYGDNTALSFTQSRLGIPYTVVRPWLWHITSSIKKVLPKAGCNTIKKLLLIIIIMKSHHFHQEGISQGCGCPYSSNTAAARYTVYCKWVSIGYSVFLPHENHPNANIGANEHD